jgi:hypothetical protein
MMSSGQHPWATPSRVDQVRGLSFHRNKSISIDHLDSQSFIAQPQVIPNTFETTTLPNIGTIQDE